jgi:hypothetical protein
MPTSYDGTLLDHLAEHIRYLSTASSEVHMMLKHVEWQMTNIKGGLGNKMEDWVEQLHQTGMRMRQRLHTVQNPLVRALA